MNGEVPVPGDQWIDLVNIIFGAVGAVVGWLSKHFWSK